MQAIIYVHMQAVLHKMHINTYICTYAGYQYIYVHMQAIIYVHMQAVQHQEYINTYSYTYANYRCVYVHMQAICLYIYICRLYVYIFTYAGYMFIYLHMQAILHQVYINTFSCTYAGYHTRCMHAYIRTCTHTYIDRAAAWWQRLSQVIRYYAYSQSV